MKLMSNIGNVVGYNFCDFGEDSVLSYYFHSCLASREGIMTLGVTLCVCPPH